MYFDFGKLCSISAYLLAVLCLHSNIAETVVKLSDDARVVVLLFQYLLEEMVLQHSAFTI